MTTEPCIVINTAIGPVDITVHVAAMFDALINSLDWGSGFLDADEVDSLLTVAVLAGFDIGEVRPVEHAIGLRGPRRTEAIARWKAQVEARNRALAEENEEGAHG
jgi:hypothetical protein